MTLQTPVQLILELISEQYPFIQTPLSIAMFHNARRQRWVKLRAMLIYEL